MQSPTRTFITYKWKSHFFFILIAGLEFVPTVSKCNLPLKLSAGNMLSGFTRFVGIATATGCYVCVCVCVRALLELEPQQWVLALHTE
jgi:hypothetical protein